MSTADDNDRKTEKASYCQQCGACINGQKAEDEEAPVAEQELEQLVREITREVIQEMKKA